MTIYSYSIVPTNIKEVHESAGFLLSAMFVECPDRVVGIRNKG